MDGSKGTRIRLAKLLGELAVHEGANKTLLAGVEVFRISMPVPRHPVVYRPRLLFVGQGRKVGYIGDEVYRYDPFNYLVLAVPIPAESEAFASPEEPLLILSIDLDPTTLGEMLLEMDELTTPFETTPRGIASTPMTRNSAGPSSGSSRASDARSTAACWGRWPSARSSIACYAASKAGPSGPWPAATTTSPASPGS